MVSIAACHAVDRSSILLGTAKFMFRCFHTKFATWVHDKFATYRIGEYRKYLSERVRFP